MNHTLVSLSNTVIWSTSRPDRKKEVVTASFFLIMSYFTYILYSTVTNRFYKGSTANLDDRIDRHNNGCEIATRAGKPWVLIWAIQHPSRSEAMALEKKVKNLSRERTIRLSGFSVSLF